MAQLGNFKYYERQRRQATIDTDFSKGMYYSSGPIEEGYVKTLINYDIASNKSSLVSRPGLRTSELILSKSKYTTSDPDPTLTGFFADNTEIYDAKDCIEGGVEYRQIILGNAATNKIWVMTVDKTAKTTEEIYPKSVLDIEDETDRNEVYTKSIAAIRQYEMNTSSYIAEPAFNEFTMDFSDSEDDSTASASCEFNGVPLYKVHDIIMESGTKHYNIVGTFGFNNNYYFLDGNSEGSILYRTVFDAEHSKYVFEQVDLKTLTASEAVSYGYNMLDSNPYVFEDHIGGSSTIQLLGILPYDASAENNGNLMMTPKKNQDIWFRCNYDIPTANDMYMIVWDWKELSADEWINIDTVLLAVSDNNPPVLEVPFKAPSENVMVRVQAYKYDTANNTFFEDVERAMTVGFDFTLDEHGTVNNLSQENYNLAHCSGMYYWKNRLVLFGLSDDPTILFISDLNEPAYFPYPNNITVFDQPVVSVIELMDNLMVFTTDKIYQVSLSEDGNSWITTIVQSNLRIDPSDRHLILTVRNMLFFKSGDHYYMVVPKSTSTTGELVLAPISTPIIELFNGFSANFSTFMHDLYSFKYYYNLIDYYNFLDYEDVHNVYVFRMYDEDMDEEKYGYFHFDLIYNTVDRTWKIYCYQTAHKIFPYQFDAARSGVFAFTDVYESPDGMSSTYARDVQLLRFDVHNSKDFYIPAMDVYWVVEDSLETLRSLALSNSSDYYFKNYQLLDTGYRNDQYHTNKRYRELQFQINNIDCVKLDFGLDFLLDGDKRKTFIVYDTQQVVDTTNANYGMVYIEPVPIMNIPEDEYNLIPDDIAFRANHWTLDESLFPEVNLWKVRVTVSGKGTAPRIRFASYNETRFEVTSINWVYRMMYMR